MSSEKLTVGDFGDEVARLHENLKKRGFEVSEEEIKRKFFGPTTRDAVRKLQNLHGLEVSGEVNKETAAKLSSIIESAAHGIASVSLNVESSEEDSARLQSSEIIRKAKYVVKGTVRFFDSFPATGVQVSAFDRDLRNEQLLGKSQTDKLGSYLITYSSHQFLKEEKGSADLVVKAFAADGSMLVASPVLFNAPLEAEVDLTIPAEVAQPPALFEKISQVLAPLLEGLEVEDLEETQEHQDISFLSGETGLQKGDLTRFVLAHKLANQGIQPEFWFVLLGGSFYQFTEKQSLEEQLALILNALPSLDSDSLHKAFIRAFTQKEIPETLKGNVDGWIEAFLKLAASRLVSESEKPTFVKLALEHAEIMNKEKQEKFASRFNEHKVLTPELLTVLEKDESFSKEEIADLRTSFQLAKITRGDFSIVKMIKDNFGIRQPEQIRTLAKKSEGEWVSLVTEKHAASETELPLEVKEIPFLKLPEAERIGKMLGNQFREAFPTTAFAGGLERALNNGGASGLRRAHDLVKFLEKHENFELLNTSVDEFFKNKIQPDFQALAKDEAFRSEVKAAQRVFKLVPTFEATDALLADGLHSAQQIYRLGQTEFVRRYADQPGFNTESARLAWNRAADTHAAVQTIVADLKALGARALPQALRNENEAISSFSNWNNLFKTGDLCECAECRSVLSPAAYFADLLIFLKDRNSIKPNPNGGFVSVKDILLSRRPDLGYLELNCDNALVSLPYIDVVCEVLEDVVAGGENDLELPGLTSMPSDAAAAKAAVAAAFASQNINLGAKFSLSQINPSDTNKWVVHSDDITYLLKKIGTPNFFAEILRNTKADDAELRAYPEYVNSKAYDKLREAKYPQNLPFDLFAEEVRASFQKTNLQRWDLMDTFRGNATPNNPSDLQIAAEYFGISSDPTPTAPMDEIRLILVADPTDSGQQVVWGETGANWLDILGNVKNFLQKTGLEYNDLLVLLDLKFINPADDMGIENLDPSCDTDKKIIKALDAPKLDRIHRFLRLWRKLRGWKMWELDLVLRTQNIGNKDPSTGEWLLNEKFLINLFYVSRLRNKLGRKITIEEICALFDNLNTETHFTKLNKKREDALYQRLFLNRKLTNPLDPAFQINPTTGDLSANEKITNHQSIILAALGIKEADLFLLKNLTKTSDSKPYISDDLDLTNLSFLWRHVQLSRLLKFKLEDWKVLLKILSQDIMYFTNPKDALEFLEKIDYIKASGFTIDELNWLLTADRSAKAAPKESDISRFLSSLRKDLQAIKAENDPAQYAFLNIPTDEGQLIGLLTTLLQKLNRNEEQVNFFLKILRGNMLLESTAQSIPPGFIFPSSITGAPNHIPISYNEPNKVIRFAGQMSVTQKNILLTDDSLKTIAPNPDYKNAIDELFQQSLLAANNYISVEINVDLPGGLRLPNDHPSIPISYNAKTKKLSFTGVMTDDELEELKAIPGNPTSTIDELYQLPRLTVKFYEPIFTASLDSLPPNIDFKTQLPTDLATKIDYDTEQRLLRFTGIMSNAEKELLNKLVSASEVAYHNAVDCLASQPQTIIPPDEHVWLTNNDIDASQPANDTFAKRLANAAKKALDHLSKLFTANDVVNLSSTQLGLTEALTRYLLTHYTLLPGALPADKPETLLTHLTQTFAATTGVVDYATLKTTFDGWFWASRVATILKKWKITLAELEKIVVLSAAAQLIDFQKLLPDGTGAIASIDLFLRTSRLVRLRDSLPETGISLLEVLEKLKTDTYTPQDFAADVERLNEAWIAPNVLSLTVSLNLNYPADYLLAESWERLHHAFYFIDSLNAGADTVKTFAAATMTDVHAKTLKELMRSKFGSETWFALSTEIQDALRERKRDALAAYLLSQPEPADVPNGKWENTNDLYAYYLLDVEMSSCQLTSRMVQGSGSIQLFVQRCFMGLEPDVVVRADGDKGDSAWRWWTWMAKYRVWEANRKVFLWPENWIEPELKKDRSPFFKDMENELLQNDINQYTVETAFLNYLEKLDGVAQLEIAGFYQEDDGDNTIIHVFGRTSGAEPHIYYYRRYDYRQWTPWEKVDLDIQGDYLIPAVVNKRLFLFWPVFTEVPHEISNSRPVNVTDQGGTVSVAKAMKKLRLQMAVSEYRQGKWTPKHVSKDFYDSPGYAVEIVKKHYVFIPIDGSEFNGTFIIKFGGYSIDIDSPDNDEIFVSGTSMYGFFELSGCKGVPEKAYHFYNALDRVSFTPNNVPSRVSLSFHKWVEQDSRSTSADDFSLISNPVLMKTPGIFKITPPWNLSYLDKLLLDASKVTADEAPTGTWLPFFYNDRERTFFVLPLYCGEGEVIINRTSGCVRNYYPEIKKILQQMDANVEVSMQTIVDEFLPNLAPDERNQLEMELHTIFPEIPEPPYPYDLLRDLSIRRRMLIFHRNIKANLLSWLQSQNFHFKNYYHPFVCDFAKLVYNPLKGIPALMSRETQLKETDFSFPQTYRPTEYVVELPEGASVSSMFSLGDIDDLRTFSTKLKQKSDNVSAFLNNQLSSVTLQALDNYIVSDSNQEQLRSMLVQDLNKIVQGQVIFDMLRFTGVILRRKTQVLLAQNPQGIELALLNRLLLEDAYPLELSRIQDYYPKENVDFSPDGAYSCYNWELFFHAPLLIAESLSKNQRFEEARDWYHFIFNPQGTESPMPGGSPMSKYWITKPFFETTSPQYIQQRIDNILRMLSGDTSVSGYSAQLEKELEDQVFDWRTNPFEPHRIASYRTVAYQKTVVMKYLDNLIAWGDFLFQQDSMESINEATQLYIMAAEILGPRPQEIPPQTEPPLESFIELEYKLDKFSNALVQAENLIPQMPGNGPEGSDPAPLPLLYFCIPENDKMLGYWDTVADRLYKIRHCMNIEGAVRQLALFEPPIEPGALVKAIAGGVDISSALADLNAPLPLYRFNVLLQKANEVCNDVKALGSALLSALEKKDAEALGLLRQGQEINLLDAVKAVKEHQIEEATENLEGLKRSKELSEIKKKYYESREFMNIREITAISLNIISTEIDTAGIAIGYILAGQLKLIPDVTLGVSGLGSPHAVVKTGGNSFGDSAEDLVKTLESISRSLDKMASIANTVASYQRRQDEWDFQKDLAFKEIEQIDKTIAAAELRIAIAEKELENHVLQIENSKATDEFMRSKYTNQELYQWQVGQISGVYFQSYKLAYDLAKRAERCFRFELGLQDSNYINFGYWDSLKKGLLSGEKLQYDLRRLETAYLEQNRREFELTKHISLILLDPLALVKLRETGKCFFNIPEEILDLDYPGHYFRRIKSVSITLPCVMGPYTTISCTLRLLKNSIRTNTANGDNGYPRNSNDQGLPTDDNRFLENNIPVKAIATSNAQNDSGVFELSFRDERYLPFEGAGIISEWSLELFNDLPSNNPDQTHPDFGKPLRQFDYSTISDAILHIKYTAREDAGAFKNDAVTHLRNYFSQDESTHSMRLFNLRQEFPTQWHRFLNPTDPTKGNVFELEMSPSLFPLKDGEKTLKINIILLLARCTDADAGNYSVIMTPPLPSTPTGSDTLTLASVNQFGGLHFSQKDVSALEIKIVPTDPVVKWKLRMTRPDGRNLQEDLVKKVMEVEDLLLILGYQWE